MVRRWQEVQANEVRFKEYYLEDAEFVVIGFGSAGRVALSAVRALRAEGIKVGLLRPITLAPFPAKAIGDLACRVKGMLVVEMNAGQMLDDVLLANQLPHPGGILRAHGRDHPACRMRSLAEIRAYGDRIPTTRKATRATAGWTRIAAVR